MLSDPQQFSGGLPVHPENLKPCVVKALFSYEEMQKLHQAFITSQLPLYLKREVIRSAEILAGSKQEIPVAFTMWLMAVNETRPEEEPTKKTAALILGGDINALQFLLREH